MARVLSGLVLTPVLTQRSVRVEMHFEPSVGILARKVDKLGLDIRSFREPLKRAVQKVMIPSIRKNFDAGGRPKWPRLAPQTIRKRGGKNTPLIKTGKLRREMGYLKIWDIDSEKAMITDLPDSIWYGKVHQAGWGGGPVTVRTSSYRKPKSSMIKEVIVTDEYEGGAIPARPFVMMHRMDEIRIEKVFNDWLGEKIREAGLGGRVTSR